MDPSDDFVHLSLDAGHDHVVNVQPQNRLHTSTRNQHRGNLKCMNSYYIHDILFTQWIGEDIHLDWRSLKQSWKDVLEIDEKVQLNQYLEKILQESFYLYRDIASKCVTVRERTGDLRHFLLPEESIIIENWKEKSNAVGYDITLIKRTIKLFMYIQLQLDETKTKLLNEYSFLFDHPSIPDINMASTSSTGATSLPDLSELSALRTEVERLRMEKESLETRLGQFQRRIEELENTNQMYVKEFERHGTSPSGSMVLHQEIDRLKQCQLKMQRELEKKAKSMTELETDFKNLFDKNVHISRKYAEAKDEIETLSYHLQQYTEKENKLTQLCDDYKQKLKAVLMERKNLYKEKENFDRHLQYYKDGCSAIRKSKDSGISVLKAEIKEKEVEIRELQKSKEGLLTRLSKVAGAKLTHDNPDITDLSDENRPTKLAEKFSELYDNEWTDALEELSEALPSELDAINLNLEIVATAYKFCSEISQLHADNIINSLTKLPTLPTETSGCKFQRAQMMQIAVPSDVNKELEDLRRRFAPQLESAVVKRFIAIIEPVILERLNLPSTMMVSKGGFPKMSASSSSFTEADGANAMPLKNREHEFNSNPNEMSVFEKFPNTKVFAEKCSSICWHMRIRDPKIDMVYNIQRGGDFNTELFRPYTCTGKTIQYVVWPVLYLHENGPLLVKGVAQPMK